MDTDLVEFRQLQEVGIFPTCVILWLRAMQMVGDVLRLELAVFSVSKALNRVEKIPIVVAVNSANPRVSLFIE